MGTDMSRVIAFVACGLTLAGCASSGYDFLPLPSSSPATVTVQFESKPQGAEAKTTIGESCRTPCALPMAPDKEFSVTFALNGYQPQTVPVLIGIPEDLPPPEGGAPRLMPNPVYVELVKGGARAPAGARKPAAAKPVAAKPAAKPVAAKPAPAASDPWPPMR
jgi:hypothetical protein